MKQFAEDAKLSLLFCSLMEELLLTEMNLLFVSIVPTQNVAIPAVSN